MKKTKHVWKCLLCLLCIGAASALTTVQAETWDVKKIRARYVQVKERSSSSFQCEDGGGNCATVSMDHLVPGIGKQHVKYTLHFTPYQSVDDGFLLDHQLELVEASYNVAAQEHYEEYLYEDSGRLIFVYGRRPDLDTGGWIESRWYFNGYQVLETSVKRKAGGKTELLPMDTNPRYYFEELLWRAQMVREMAGSMSNAMFPEYKYTGRYSTAYDGDDFDVKGYLIEKMQEDILMIPGAAKYSTMLSDEPSESEPYYTIRLGENKDTNFCTLYWFRVYPLEALTNDDKGGILTEHKGIIGRYYLIKMYDVATDSEWLIDDWLKTYGEIQ